MRIQPVLGSVVGVADDNHWGQVFLSPAAYGVVEVDDPHGHARAWGVGVLGHLSEQTVDPPKSLKQTQEVAIKSMEERVVSLVLLVSVGNILYIATLGESRVLLKRGEKLAVLMDKPGAISGEVQEGDVIVLLSKSVTQSIPHEELERVFDHLDAPAIAEKMTLLLHTHDGATGGAAHIFQVKGLTPVEAEESLSAQADISSLPVSWRRPMVPITALLVILFLASIVLGIRRQITQKQNSRVTRVLSQAGYAFEEGVALLPLNAVKGRERLTSAKDLISPIIEGISPSSADGRALTKLYKDVVDQLAIAMQVTRGEPTLFYDLSLLKPGTTIHAMGQDGDTMGLVDTNALTVVALTVLSKNGQIVAGGESYRGAQLITIHGDSLYVLVAAGIHRASVREGKTTPLVVKKPARPAGGDSQWGAIGAMVSYGGNLYLLDTGKSRIWKYVATDLGFSQTREYLNPDTLPDFSQATGMAIDSGVWVGTKDGKILHFVQGKEETFVPQGVEPALGKTLVVATTEEDKNLYVLDSDNKRVVVLDKDGVYLAQYVWTGVLTPTQLVVSEKLKLILLLADGKLYSIELK